MAGKHTRVATRPPHGGRASNATHAAVLAGRVGRDVRCEPQVLGVADLQELHVRLGVVHGGHRPVRLHHRVVVRILRVERVHGVKDGVCAGRGGSTAGMLDDANPDQPRLQTRQPSGALCSLPLALPLRPLRPLPLFLFVSFFLLVQSCFRCRFRCYSRCPMTSSGCASGCSGRNPLDTAQTTTARPPSSSPLFALPLPLPLPPLLRSSLVARRPLLPLLLRGTR